jgi:branched-chain amino acid transport system permease protein
MRRKWWLKPEWILLAAALLLPLSDSVLARIGLRPWAVGNEVCQRVIVFALMGLGLNVVVGYTGLLHLGVAAFMAIGVYAYAILSCSIYPFQIGFWGAILLAPVVGLLAGLLLGSPTLRLRGDYLAIVTLGFGEIIQDVLRNLDPITQGTQGINPLPPPRLFGHSLEATSYQSWYYLYLAILVLAVIVVRNLEKSRLGRQWVSVREDELAAGCMGINATRAKLSAFAICAAICALSGVLYASKLETTAEPNTYDFMVSITVLCILIVGGMGSIRGVLFGAAIVMGFDIFLKKATEAMQRAGLSGSDSVFLTPSNWKFLFFGAALVIMMRYRPHGVLPASRSESEPGGESNGGGGTQSPPSATPEGAK